MRVKMTLNGKPRSIDIDPSTPLLWVIRDSFGLKGTKFGCGAAQCGACTVHVDNAAVRSCSFPVDGAHGKSVTSIEGLDPANAHPLQQAWIAHNVPQCGYCQPGFIMAAAALLKTTPDPTDAQIDASLSNICRCGTYPRIRAAIHAAARASETEATR
ncbi:(2Fe-2S)-binding protein [Methylobacterium soli]|uniref:(2Fe-2S)-binding protein n=1 Tax=Methylobacterium soli TaxID=553447 RepID=A0A6L3T150_9HYPH|nr:(2Fe-2S)-binding protein [Methylobacterium soli]KAB1080292.1 (2Fe-2S)-binding protein [Methylobacterium soli]GJE44733.1 Isoquinoline 1-oxidoreductase subunit alpha [Methylobacterium soli]